MPDHHQTQESTPKTARDYFSFRAHSIQQAIETTTNHTPSLQPPPAYQTTAEDNTRNAQKRAPLA
eukprot:1180229-Prorocentrum_minimum.AAC.6